MRKRTLLSGRSSPSLARKKDSISHWIWLHGIVRGSVKLQKDLKEFVGLFLSRKVEFVVVGGHAVAFHGYPRLTDDLDLFIVPAKENAERIIETLKEFGFDLPNINLETLQHPDRVIQLGRAPNRIDLLTQVSGVSAEEVWRSRVEGDLGGLKVPFIGKQALIQNKRATGRPQDLADLHHLEP
jgi:predicted nucleotidyltransferase